MKIQIKVGFYACARSPNENIYITQKLARVACGTQNVDHCARICHGPTVAGLLLPLVQVL